MKPPRFSVAKLMAVVSLVAVNLAAARALISYDLFLLTGIALPLLTLQVGLHRVICRRGRVRPFWAGFIACGLGAIMSFYWALAFPNGVGRYVDPGTGRVVELIPPGSLAWTLWSYYDEFVKSCIERLPDALQIDLDGVDVVSEVMSSLIWSLPQLLLALAGGLLVALAVRRPGKTSALPGVLLAAETRRPGERTAQYPSDDRIVSSFHAQSLGMRSTEIV